MALATLLAKPLMKISVAGCKDNFKYTLLSENQDMIKLQPFQLSANVLSTIILIVFLLIIDKIIQPVHRGFFCDDHSIMKPYVKQTISPLLILVITTILVLLLVVGTEHFKKSKKKESVCKEQEIGYVYIGNIKIKSWVYRILSQLSFVVIGLTMSMVFTDIGKKMVGRLRPHFLSVCLPNYSKFNCSDGYITADVCTSQNKERLLQARLSFPSGHSSSAAFVSVLLALYIEYAIPLKQFNMIKPIIQFILISLGVSCGYTRISDYWHHWSDVLVGFVIGTVFAIYTIFGLMKLNSKEPDHFIQDVECQPTHSYDNQMGYSNSVQE